ncbi:LysR family transcriptional regulator [Siccirubricoccus phaeus]|uniref:LysR family transcriptional regulator n=1 Tax=Siccirubricoccus phaeus TaxID=2595053 RepID=UPI0011F1A490|nr:LysR family transcriptional regulator [Siccirubricoccus phaeus]
MDLSLRALRYLVTVADQGSVTAAARRLHVSQPAISEALAALEAEFGLPLFLRHHARGVTPTPAGARVVAEARQLLAHAADVARTARALGGAPAGEITLGCFLTVAPRFLPRLLAAFAARHPAIAVRLEEGDQQELLTQLALGRTELALAYDFALPETVEAETLAELPPHAVLPLHHPLAKRPRLKLEELAGERLLLLDLPHSRDYFYSLFRAKGLEPRIGFASRSQELIRGMVGNGHGFAIQNAVAQSAHAVDGSRVTTLPLDPDLRPVRLMLLSPRGLPARPAVAAFAGFVREAFAVGGLFDE